MELSSPSIKRVVYLLIVCCSAFLSAYYLRVNPQNHWLIWSALVIAFLTLNYTNLSLLICTGLMMAAMVFLTGLLGVNIYLLSGYLFLVTFTCFLIEQRYPQYFLIPFIVALFTIAAVSIHLPLTLNADRTLYIIAGILIATGLHLIFLYKNVRAEFSSWLRINLITLSSLTQDIFACLLRPEYVDNVYLFERRIHVQKHRFFQSVARLRELAFASERKLHLSDQQLLQALLEKLETIFNIMMDCAQLRKRVSDHSTFQLCSDELREIALALKNLFNQLLNLRKTSEKPLDISLLAASIKRFEENYANVLQVSSKEPLVFLLFISSLTNLREAMESLSTSLPALKRVKLSKWNANV